MRGRPPRRHASRRLARRSGQQAAGHTRGRRGHTAERHDDHAAGLEHTHDDGRPAGLDGGDVRCGGSCRHRARRGPTRRLPVQAARRRHGHAARLAHELHAARPRRPTSVRATAPAPVVPGHDTARPAGQLDLHLRRRVQRHLTEHERLGTPGDGEQRLRQRRDGLLHGQPPDHLGVGRLPGSHGAPGGAVHVPGRQQLLHHELRGRHGLDRRTLRSDLRRVRGQCQASAVGGRRSAGDDVAAIRRRSPTAPGRTRARSTSPSSTASIRASMCPTSTTRTPRPIPTPRRTTASSTRTRSTPTAWTGRRLRSPSCTTANRAWSTRPSTGSEPFDQPFFIALTQALGVGTNHFTPGTTELPATTQIDWVRAWAPAS